MLDKNGCEMICSKDGLQNKKEKRQETMSVFPRHPFAVNLYSLTDIIDAHCTYSHLTSYPAWSGASI